MSETTLGLVLDCTYPAKLADFWAPALGYTNIGAAGELRAVASV